MSTKYENNVIGLLFIVLGVLLQISYKLNAIGAETVELSLYTPTVGVVDFIFKMLGGSALIIYGIYKFFSKKT